MLAAEPKLSAVGRNQQEDPQWPGKLEKHSGTCLLQG